MRIALLMLLAIATDAAADWQFTRWGMSVDEVVKASNGRATETTPEERRKNSPADQSSEALLKSPYESGRFKFRAFFEFRAGKLQQVNLGSDENETCGSLETSLEQKYGTPESRQRSEVGNFATWRTQSDEINLVALAPNGRVENCSLIYRQRMNADNRGL